MYFLHELLIINETEKEKGIKKGERKLNPKKHRYLACGFEVCLHELIFTVISQYPINILVIFRVFTAF